MGGAVASVPLSAVVKAFTAYTKITVDALHAIRQLAVKLGVTSKELEDVLADDAEYKERYRSIDRKKRRFVVDIQEYALSLAITLGIVRRRIGDHDRYPTLGRCYGEFDISDMHSKLKALQNRCEGLGDDLREFQSDFERKYNPSGWWRVGLADRDS